MLPNVMSYAIAFGFFKLVSVWSVFDLVVGWDDVVSVFSFSFWFAYCLY
jgi:hypothetical protein